MTKQIFTAYGFNNNEIVEARIENVSTTPAPGNPGRLIFNTATAKLLYDTGSVFVEIGSGTGVGGMLQSVYDTDDSGVVDAAESVAWTGVTGKPDTFAPAAHTHVVGDITDFTTAVNTQVAAYWDSIAGSDANADTIRETLDIILANAASLQEQIGRFNADIGDGTATSFALNHGLNSTDITVEAYDIASGETVGVGVTRTTADVVTITASPPLATDAVRVVVKK